MSPRLCFCVLQDRFRDQLGQGLTGSTRPTHSRQAEKSLVKVLLQRCRIRERKTTVGITEAPAVPPEAGGRRRSSGHWSWWLDGACPSLEDAVARDPAETACRSLSLTLGH